MNSKAWKYKYSTENMRVFCSHTQTAQILCRMRVLWRMRLQWRWLTLPSLQQRSGLVFASPGTQDASLASLVTAYVPRPLLLFFVFFVNLFLCSNLIFLPLLRFLLFSQGFGVESHKAEILYVFFSRYTWHLTSLYVYCEMKHTFSISNNVSLC